MQITIGTAMKIGLKLRYTGCLKKKCPLFIGPQIQGFKAFCVFSSVQSGT